MGHDFHSCAVRQREALLCAAERINHEAAFSVRCRSLQCSAVQYPGGRCRCVRDAGFPRDNAWMKTFTAPAAEQFGGDDDSITNDLATNRQKLQAFYEMNFVLGRLATARARRWISTAMSPIRALIPSRRTRQLKRGRAPTGTHARAVATHQ